jgi:p-cumate 2,3-dioxygenase beta subunit
MTLPERLVLRLRVEEFLIEEAAILDEWRLDDWLELFTEDASYVVPTTDKPDGDPAVDLTLIDDDHLRLTWRVNRLKSRHAHREYPWSRTRRVISNVRVLAQRGDELDVTCTVVIFRFRHRQDDHFVASYKITLLDDGERLRIRSRRAEVDQEALTPNGALSMIL